MRLLFIAQCCGGDQLTSKFGSDLEHGNGHRAGLHSHCLAPGHNPFIRRLIWFDQLYWLGHVASRMYIPQLPSPYHFDEGVQVGVWLDMSFCPIQVVVGLVDLPYCISTALARGLLR